METKKTSLYELLTEQQAIAERIRENAGELDDGIEQAIAELAEKVPAKIEGYSALVRQAELAASSFKEQEESLKAARQACEKFAANLEERLKGLMMEKGIDRLDGNSVYYRLSKPTFRLALDPTLRPEDLPKEYVRTVVTLEVEKKKIEADLKDGKAIPGASLTTSQSLRMYPLGGGK